MDNGQYDQNVDHEQAQPLFDAKTSDNQDQKDNTSIKNDVLTPEEVTLPDKSNIAGEQNVIQVKNIFDAVQKPEVMASDPVGIDKKGINNEQDQSSLNTNIGDTNNKDDRVNTNKDTPSRPADTQLDKDKVLDSELDNLLSSIDKGETTQKLEDAQIKNVLGDIKAQITSATNNPAELMRLASTLATLASSTNNPELLKQIKSMIDVVASKEETAEKIIRDDIVSDNPAAQELTEHTEQKANIARYTAIKDDFHKKLDEDLALLDAAIDPSIASQEQIRILEDNLTDVEREEIKRKTQLKKEGYEHVYNIKENAEQEIEQNNTKITGIDERLKILKEDSQRQLLEAEKQQYIKANAVRQQELDDYVKSELEKRDKEREKLTQFTKLKERVEKYPNTTKRLVHDHFKLHAAEYDKNPDRTAINELNTMVRKVGLAEELGVSSTPQEINQKQSVQKISEIQEVGRQDVYKAINQVHDKYSGEPIPRKETDEVANIMLQHLGYAEHAKIIAEKKQVQEITNEKTNTISPPPKTPAVDKNGPGGGPAGGIGRHGV